MKKLFTAFTVFFCLTISNAFGYFKDFEEKLNRNIDSKVYILKVNGGRCSAFAIKDYLLTAWHCFMNTKTKYAKVWLSDYIIKRVKLVKYNEKMDIALLKPLDFKIYHYFKVAKIGSDKKGVEIIGVGSYPGSINQINFGNIVARNIKILPIIKKFSKRKIKILIPQNNKNFTSFNPIPGQSGGPVFLKDFSIVGIITGYRFRVEGFFPIPRNGDMIRLVDIHAFLLDVY